MQKVMFLQVRPDVFNLESVMDLLDLGTKGAAALTIYYAAGLLTPSESGEHFGVLGDLDYDGTFKPWDAKQLARRLPLFKKEDIEEAWDLWHKVGIAVTDEDGATKLLLIDYLTKSQTTRAKKARATREKGTDLTDLYEEEETA